ncbi:adenosine receptor A3-like [Anneissia japonica]|uniref:adenosine receptor A3-like n=1 Tax=Anneissia japonica TaxID=1529436 RepID=UPI0014257350|nr:adenosine receptor A3-like [Anneissia japonica]
MEKLEVVAVTGMVILSLFAIIGNTTIIALFFKVRSLQTPSNIFVVSLAFTELFVGGILYPVQCLFDFKVINDNPGCIIFACLAMATALVHVLTILSLSIERLVTICKPMVYSTIITEKRCYTTLFLISVYSLLNGLLPVITPIGVTSSLQKDCRMDRVLVSEVYVLWLYANWILSLLVVIIISIKLFFVVRRHSRAIAATELQRATTRVAVNRNETNSRFKLKREAKSAFLLISIVVYLTITWIPRIVATLIKDESQLVHMITHFLIYSNTVATPFIYGFGNKLYRQHFISMLRS